MTGIIMKNFLDNRKKWLPLQPQIRENPHYYMGKSYTTSSLGIPQGLTAARVLGCSGAM